MNLNFYITRIYENKSNWTLGENKPNSNPIKPNCRKAKMNVNLTLTKDYRKYDDFAVRKNKPNSNPISVKPKMSVNLYFIEDYENKTAFRPQKNKPNSNPISSKAKMNLKSLAGKSGLSLILLLTIFNMPGKRQRFGFPQVGVPITQLWIMR